MTHYESPEIEVVELDKEDILTSSTDNVGAIPDDWGSGKIN